MLSQVIPRLGGDTCVSDVPSFVSVFLVELCLLALTLVLGKKRNFCEVVKDMQILQRTLLTHYLSQILSTLLQDCCYWLQFTDMLVETGTAGERWMAF